MIKFFLELENAADAVILSYVVVVVKWVVGWKGGWACTGRFSRK